MRNYERTPNVFLTRFGFYSDCTIGKLTAECGSLICFTLEPPYRPPGERTIIGNTAIPEGTYPLKMEYDVTLKYKCLRVCDVKGFKNIRLCFLTKAQATANQTKGNILLGSRVVENEGKLEDCISAFELLNTYYEAKRCNHSQLCLQIRSEGFSGRKCEAFTQAPPEVDRPLQDYELQTL